MPISSLNSFVACSTPLLRKATMMEWGPKSSLKLVPMYVIHSQPIPQHIEEISEELLAAQVAKERQPKFTAGLQQDLEGPPATRHSSC